MMLSQPILIPAPGSPTTTISSLSLSHTPPSPVPSELSLPPSPSSGDESDSESVADTSDSCCDPCCFPPSSSANSLPPVILDEADFVPLIVVGAGPHGLALAARLSEPRPAALYTDLEHARLSWLQRENASGSGTSKKTKRATVKGHWNARKLVQPDSVTLAPAETARPSIAVLDSTSDGWLGRWRGFFQGLGIKHLRSPMLFHPSPADADALVAYARRMGKEDELEPVKGVVGREYSKYQRKKHPGRVGRAVTVNERSREDYFRPSTSLFHSFIDTDLIERYSVSPLVCHTTATSVSYRDIQIRGRGVERGFVIESRRSDGTLELRGAKAVTMAIGPSSVPNVPPVLKAALPRRLCTGDEDEGRSPWRTSEICGEGWCHSAAFSMPGLRPMEGELGQKVKSGRRTHVVVVGGGLTSAQIVDSLLTSHPSLRVTLLSRSHLKVKHFDFDLELVSKYNNLWKMAFWQEDDRQARWEKIQQARNGGSVNPQFYRTTMKHVKEGRLDLRTLTEVRKAEYDEGRKKWMFEVATRPDVKTAAKAEAAGRVAEETMTTLEDVDYLVCSTGSKIDLAGVPFIQPLLKSNPIELVNGLPVLTSDLQWDREVPLFVMGAYAMLELGPDALNLSGTRAGAERIAHRLGELGVFDDDEGGGVHPVDKDRGKSSRTREKESRSGGLDNYFAGLGEVEA
ncbi:hypothetical protein JCM11641_001172 [Rhodosporidiobolus odoratus]